MRRPATTLRPSGDPSGCSSRRPVGRRFALTPTNLLLVSGHSDTYATPYGAVAPGLRRTESLCGRLILNTGRPHTGTAERKEDELENRSGHQALGHPRPLGRVPTPVPTSSGYGRVPTGIGRRRRRLFEFNPCPWSPSNAPNLIFVNRWPGVRISPSAPVFRL
jgi:hypothetical protein